MSNPLFVKASFIQSPIGHIPKEFRDDPARLKQLCKAASIRYLDVKIDKEGTLYRDWHIVADDRPAFDRRGNQRGKASTLFHKYCMLLDYLVHQNPFWSRTEILSASIQPDATARKLMQMGWGQMNDELAKIGVDGYDIIRSKKQKEDHDPFDL